MQQFSPEQFQQRAQQQQIPIISDATASFLHELVQQHRPLQVVEIGTAIGWSSYLLGKQLRDRGGRIYSFEVSFPSYHVANWRRNRTKSRNVHLFHADFLQIDLGVCGIQQVDFVFIDGMKAQYAEYLHKIRPYCHADSIVVGDDVIAHHDKMEAFWQYLANEQIGYEVKELADGDGVAVINGL